MAARSRLIVSAVAALALALPVGAAWAQDDQGGDRERLRREQAEQLRDLARQAPPPGAQQFIIGIGGEGVGQMRRVGPPEPEMVPTQMHLVGDGHYLLVVRGFMLHLFATGEALHELAQADLRTPEEMGQPQPQAAEGGMTALGLPDPATVPVTVRFSADGTSLFVLRGYMLYQFAVEGLTRVAEFDLRSEEERHRPRVQMRMMMGPAFGPAPPPGEAPPPPQ
ncbi:MAG: hypothetical protein AB7Y46_05110 [Armatimonadota bacterium]